VTHNPRLTTYASRVITMLDGKIDTDSNDLPTKSLPSTLAKRSLGRVLSTAEKAS
jgi:ABC-type lipoprotein export system ATPase subunit